MRTSQKAILFLPVLAAGPVACNGILGFSDFSIVSDAGTDGGHPTTDAPRDAGHDTATGRDGNSSHNDAHLDVTVPTDGNRDDATDARHDVLHDAPRVHDAGAEASCDETGTTRPTFEQACTTAICEPFAARASPSTARCYLFPASMRGQQAMRGARATPVTQAALANTATDGGSNLVYATGSSALAVLLAAAATALSGTVNFVYQTTASCTGVTAMLDSGYLMTGTAVYYTSTGAAVSCALPAGGVSADIGISDVFASTCQPLTGGLPPTIQENYGPVQVMTFVVPATSSQTSISLAAAYDVFGFGSQSQVSPWTNASYVFQRTSTSGTQNMIGATIHVPPTSWQGTMHASTGAMVAALVAAGKDDAGVPDETIGILVAGSADENRSTIHELAFVDTGESCGYYPDSTSGAFDLANARNGHYPIWGPSHFYNRTNGSGQPLNPYAQKFIDDLSGITPLPGVDLLALYASKGVNVVPLCAMHVTRTSDGADYSPYTPPTSCNCYYDEQATGSTSCKTCTTATDCPVSAPACNRFNTQAMGYCEPE